MHKKLISVIVPIYNVEDYLEECLDSILAQDYPNYELLLVDDCSTDGSLAIAERYAEANSHASCVKMETNSGQSHARNHALQLAQGDYVIFVDSDDLLTETHAFSQLVSALEANDVDMVMAPHILYEESSNQYKNGDNGINYIYSHHNKNIIDGHGLISFIESVFVSPHSKIFRLSVIRSNKIFFPEGLKFEDILFFWHYIISSNGHFFLLNNPHYIYRINSKSISFRSDLGSDLVPIAIMLSNLFKSHPNYYYASEAPFTNFMWSVMWWIRERPTSYQTFKSIKPLLKIMDSTLLHNQSRRTNLEFKLLIRSPLLSYFYFNIIHDHRFSPLLTGYKASSLGRITLIAIKLACRTLIIVIKFIRGVILLPINLYKYATRPVKTW